MFIVIYLKDPFDDYKYRYSDMQLWTILLDPEPTLENVRIRILTCKKFLAKFILGIFGGNIFLSLLVFFN
jgi:hypothetical protein